MDNGQWTVDSGASVDVQRTGVGRAKGKDVAGGRAADSG